MRYTHILIVLMCLCLILVGCNAPAPTQTPTAYALQVQVSINPELVIALDAQGNVCNVTCQNPDAEAVCKDLPYAGIPFDRYFTTLLEACIQQGYLKDSAEVSVQVMGSDTPLSDSLRQTVTQQAQDVLNTISQAQNLTFSRTVILDGQVVYSEVPEPQPPHAQEQYDEQGNLIYYRDLQADGVTYDVYLDSTGRIIKEIYTNPDASGSMTQYNAQGLQELFEYYGPGGVLITRLTRVYHNGDPLHYTETNLNNESTEYKCNPDGSIIYSRLESANGDFDETWFENGVIIKSHSITTQDDGTKVDAYFEKGILVSQKSTSPDGTKVDTYFEKGIITSETRIQPDGVRMETSFDNGVPVLESWSTPDGEVWEVHYKNGVISKANGIFGDSVWYKIYTNGVMTLYRRDASDGTYWEERYTESGVLYYHATYHAGLGTGSIDTITFNPNGTKAYQITENVDGSTYEVTHDSEGKPISWRHVDANGNVTQGIFDANGNPIDQ